MKVQAYLKIKKGLPDRYSGSPSMELSVSKIKPAVQANEVLTLLNLDIPDELFDRPILEANIIVKAPKSASVPTFTVEAGALTDWIENK